MLVIQEKESCLQTIKGSRFIGYAMYVSDEEEVKKVLENLKSEHPRANHHCFAWRFSEGRERSSDDGEPKGSAGSPILKRIVSKDCVNTIVVVVRYFGGTKLGIGGLIRAYGGVAQELMERATFEEYRLWVRVSFSYAYEDSRIVSSVLSHIEHKIVSQSYADSIQQEILVVKGNEEHLQKTLFAESRGRITSSLLVP